MESAQAWADRLLFEQLPDLPSDYCTGRLGYLTEQGRGRLGDEEIRRGSGSYQNTMRHMTLEAALGLDEWSISCLRGV